jgi:hypothetical protein
MFPSVRLNHFSPACDDFLGTESKRGWPLDKSERRVNGEGVVGGWPHVCTITNGCLTLRDFSKGEHY